jgi:hypothetical protein
MGRLKTSLKEENTRLRKIIELYEEIIKYQDHLLAEEREARKGRIIL